MADGSAVAHDGGTPALQRVRTAILPWLGNDDAFWFAVRRRRREIIILN